MVSSLAGPLGAMSLTKQCHGPGPGARAQLHELWAAPRPVAPGE
jgi:hypothetical protein